MFSTGSLVLQLSYLLLVLAVVASGRRRSRLFLAAAAIAAIAHAAFWSHDPLTIVWMVLLLIACLLAFIRDALDARRTPFSAEEEAMLASFLAGFPRPQARHLIDQGVWVHGTEGEELTREGEPVERVLFLVSGEAQVLSQGRRVATCRPGDLVGEAGVLSGDPATATVVLAGPARMWCASAEALRPFLAANPELRTALERSFARAVRAKLWSSNRNLAAASAQD